MGAAESKLAFRKQVFALFEQRNIPSEDKIWEGFYQLPDSAEDIFNLFSPKDIRRVRDSAPENFITLIKKVSEKIIAFTQPRTTRPSASDFKQILNCVRILTRVLPYLFEMDDQSLEESLFWSLDDGPDIHPDDVEIGADGSLRLLNDESDKRFGAKLVRATVGLLFFKGFTLPDSVAVEEGVVLQIWNQGIGTSTNIGSTHEINNNRTETLRLLLAFFSRVVYVAPSDIINYRNNWTLVVIAGLEKKQTLTLMCSLINTAINYDPVGWGLIPYNHVIFGDSQEHLATLSVQAITAILDARDPSADLGKNGAWNRLRTRESTYLPGANKRINLQSEVLMLFWQLIQANEVFVRIRRHPDHSSRRAIGLVRLCCFLLQTMSQERSFGVQLNTSFDHSAVNVTIKDLPAFQGGNWGDFLILSVHAIVTTSGKTQVSTLFETLMVALVNTSPYLKGMTIMTLTKLMNLLSSFSNPAFLLVNEANHRLLYYLVEMFNNLIQYQLTGNTHLVYAIIRNKEKIFALRDMTFASANAELQRLKTLRYKLTHSNASPTASDSAAPKRVDSEVLFDAEASPSAEDTAADKDQVPAEAPRNPANTEGAPPKPSLDGPSEKARGKMPAYQQDKFVPTEEWFNFWKMHLPLTVLLTIAEAMGPVVEQYCVDKELNDDRRVLEYLQSGTLVGILPPPHKIFTRRFPHNEAVAIWFTSYLWGTIFLKSGDMNAVAETAKLCPPIWTGTHIKLFLVKMMV
ncbi:high-temperature-induced dauer-formation protein-domain-containing protein [Polychytrium aggregatum]|uniref:high-temperature-induced dauer-formation protein-domain-containing protein n=1 Tax=Polychytrium aggregatum TaxID=110093 RepID=UPI0022FF3EC6|nr:high-temperature-induced dauer-formation protein-domain-containing protein [Polychytrium aggregatum]KAI9199583.1 high-temperature-induced dauer-formation protein-domain-containing protein [Polychytrium aggregatum]